MTASQMTTLDRITRDIVQSAADLDRNEARFLVDTYYQVQDYRKTAANQIRSLMDGVDDSGELSNPMLRRVYANFQVTEDDIRKALSVYTDNHAIGQWSRSITGIGPVIAAGLMAHIDIERSPSVTSIWRYAGLDPTSKWLGRKGAQEALDAALALRDEDEHQLVTPEEIKLVTEGRGVLTYADIANVAQLTNRKPAAIVRACADDQQRVTQAALLRHLARRPWNAQLKVLCWKIGESFVKQSGNPNDHYGHFYHERKAYETFKNANREYAEQAARQLSERSYGRDTEAYKHLIDGMLPPAQIHLRCQRFAVKLFLSHWFAVAYELHYGQPPAQPYAIAHLEHVDYIAPYNWPMQAK